MAFNRKPRRNNSSGLSEPRVLDVSQVTDNSHEKARFRSTERMDDVNLAEDMKKNTYQVNMGNKKVVF